jgi:hypothetical protein
MAKKPAPQVTSAMKRAVAEVIEGAPSMAHLQLVEFS